MAKKKRGRRKKVSHKMMYKKAKGSRKHFMTGQKSKGHVPIKVLRHNLGRVAAGIRRNPNATQADKERVEGL